MTEVIGEYPEEWTAVAVGADPDVDEERSDGDQGTRIVPDHLADVDAGGAGAILVQHVVEEFDSGLEDEYWNLALQSAERAEDGSVVYETVWHEDRLADRYARGMMGKLVRDLENVAALHDVPRLQHSPGPDTER